MRFTQKIGSLGTFLRRTLPRAILLAFLSEMLHRAREHEMGIRMTLREEHWQILWLASRLAGGRYRWRTGCVPAHTRILVRSQAGRPVDV